jgi:hypothetical protein
MSERKLKIIIFRCLIAVGLIQEEFTKDKEADRDIMYLSLAGLKQVRLTPRLLFLSLRARLSGGEGAGEKEGRGRGEGESAPIS